MNEYFKQIVNKMKAYLDTKYYSFIVSRDEKIIGKYPQVRTDTKPLEWLLPPLNEEIRHDKFLNLEKYFDIILDDKANLTDVIERASLSWGIVINDRLKSIISKLNVPPHRFYPINVFHQNKRHQYYWFHFYDDLFKYVQLDKSYFELCINKNYEVIETLPVSSEEFIRTVQSSTSYDRNVKLKEIIFKDTFPKYDIFENNILGFVNVISEKFLENIIKENISGYEAYPLDHFKGYQED